MAVIVRRKAIINGKEIVMTPFLGEGKITKDDMEKARRLDKYLEQKMNQILKDMKREGSLNANALKKWHALGEKLSFIDDKNLVNPEDINNGYIWLAIRQYCPLELLPKGTQKTNVGATTGARREGKKYDHLHYCYQLGKHKWKDIDCVGEWFNWITLMESPGLMRDPRVIPTMKQIVKGLGRTITKNEFRAFAKSLRKFFSTKEAYRDTIGLSDAKIKEIIIKSARESRIIKTRKKTP
ncbi:MAG: hypothetical protein ABIJ37_06680 [Pseudomonadota bacterium]